MGDHTLRRSGQFFAAINTKSIVITDFRFTAWAFHLITILGGLPVKAEKIREAFCLSLWADYLSPRNKPNFGGNGRTRSSAKELFMFVAATYAPAAHRGRQEAVCAFGA